MEKNKKQQKKNKKTTTIIVSLIVGALFIFGILNVLAESGTKAFTITEHTVYDISENTIYINITENLGKDQTINISSIFNENELTNKISYLDFLVLQDTTKDIYGLVNESVGKYNNYNEVIKNESITYRYYKDDKDVELCKSFIDENSIETLLTCDYILGDKSVIKTTNGVVDTIPIKEYLSMPYNKEKIIIDGLKIENKQNGIPLAKNSMIQLKLTYSHPISTSKNEPTEIQNKYDIEVCSSDGVDCTVLDPTWWNDSWTHNSEIPISENSGATLTNYQVMLNVTHETEMNTSFSDLRFLNSALDTELDYWINPILTVNGSSAIVWVEVPSLSASTNTSIYMYFGNDAVLTTSNGNDTFLYFDDFENGNLDNWGTSGTVALSSTQARDGSSSVALTGNNGRINTLTTNKFEQVKGRGFYSIWIRDTTARVGRADFLNDGHGAFGTAPDKGTINKFENGNIYTMPIWTDLGIDYTKASWNDIEMRWNADTDKFIMLSNNISSAEAGFGAGTTDIDEFTYICEEAGQISYIDLFYVAKYTYTNEPTYSISASATPSCLYEGYVFDGSAVALQGANVTIFNQYDVSEYYKNTTDSNGYWTLDIANSTSTYMAGAYYNNTLIGQLKPFISGTC